MPNNTTAKALSLTMDNTANEIQTKNPIEKKTNIKQCLCLNDTQIYCK